jgi:hypothetical protein
MSNNPSRRDWHSGKPEKLRSWCDQALGFIGLVAICFGTAYWFLYQLSEAM